MGMSSRVRAQGVGVAMSLAIVASAFGLAGPVSSPLGASEAAAAQAPRGSAYCGRANQDDSVVSVATCSGPRVDT